ncbi:MAG: EamA family transporter [Chitinophagaceae bacterium]|jgi:drug/metabolite transporter (DMT)-like permease|nr:EamA family transporter [Chitinophagaceae bacterium]
MKPDLKRAYIALALVSFFWGTTYLAARISAGDIPGLYVAGIRQFVAGLILVLWFKSRGAKWPGLRSLKHIALQGFFLLCIANGLLTWAMEYITSGLGAIIAGLVPLFIAIFSIILLRHAKFTRFMIAGLVIGFAGIATIFYEYIEQLFDPGFAFGTGLALVATISWSFGTVYTSRKKNTIPILFAVGLQMLIAGVIILVVCFTFGKYTDLSNASADALISLLYLVIFGSLLAYSAYVFAISKLPPTQVSVYAYINPIVAVVCGWLVLNEKMNVSVLTGTLITIAGVYMVNREFKKQQA